MENKELFNESADKSLLASFSWWEKKRLLYNIVMLITGLISILSIGDFDFFGFLGVVVYGVLANVFYCLGFFVEVAAQHYLKSRKDFKHSREAIFWIGLVFSVLLTIWIGVTSYTVVPD